MSYVAAGYAVTFVTLGSYALWVLRRRRSLDRLLRSDGRPGRDR
ncbi:MAG: CcmD family protein [Acidimicrobiales bacterium]